MSFIKELALLLMILSSSIVLIPYIYLNLLKLYKNFLYKERRKMAKRLKKYLKIKKIDVKI